MNTQFTLQAAIQFQFLYYAKGTKVLIETGAM